MCFWGPLKWQEKILWAEHVVCRPCSVHIKTFWNEWVVCVNDFWVCTKSDKCLCSSHNRCLSFFALNLYIDHIRAFLFLLVIKAPLLYFYSISFIRVFSLLARKLAIKFATSIKQQLQNSLLYRWRLVSRPLSSLSHITNNPGTVNSRHEELCLGQTSQSDPS